MVYQKGTQTILEPQLVRTGRILLAILFLSCCFAVTVWLRQPPPDEGVVATNITKRDSDQRTVVLHFEVSNTGSVILALPNKMSVDYRLGPSSRVRLATMMKSFPRHASVTPTWTNNSYELETWATVDGHRAYLSEALTKEQPLTRWVDHLLILVFKGASSEQISEVLSAVRSSGDVHLDSYLNHVTTAEN